MNHLIAFLLAVLLALGCGGCAMAGVDDTLNAAERSIDRAVDTVENVIQTAAPATTAPAPGARTTQRLTEEQAKSIVLEHAGFTADQVTGLRTEYEIDDGIPRYEVQFRQGRWEYDYEINAETGAILSYDRDD